MKLLICRDKTMYVYHASGKSFPVSLRERQADGSVFEAAESLPVGALVSVGRSFREGRAAQGTRSLAGARGEREVLGESGVLGGFEKGTASRRASRMEISVQFASPAASRL